MSASRRFLITTTIILLTLSAGIAVATLQLPGHSDVKSEEPEIRKYILGLQQDDFATYLHPEYGYSFSYPKDFIISTFKDGDSDVVVAEHPKLVFGFQIVVQPAGEEGPITKERILQDDASIVVENPWEFFIDDETPALRFSSRDAAGQETRETWFVHASNFYQITLYSAEPGRLDPYIRMLNGHFNFGVDI